MTTENTVIEPSELSNDVSWKEFQFAADAWQWLDEQDFRACAVDHLSFRYADGSTTMLYLPIGESADTPTTIKIRLWRKNVNPADISSQTHVF